MSGILYEASGKSFEMFSKFCFCSAQVCGNFVGKFVHKIEGNKIPLMLYVKGRVMFYKGVDLRLSFLRGSFNVVWMVSIERKEEN